MLLSLSQFTLILLIIIIAVAVVIFVSVASDFDVNLPITLLIELPSSRDINKHVGHLAIYTKIKETNKENNKAFYLKACREKEVNEF